MTARDCLGEYDDTVVDLLEARREQRAKRIIEAGRITEEMARAALVEFDLRLSTGFLGRGSYNTTGRSAGYRYRGRGR